MQDEMLLVDFKNAQAWNEWVQTKEWQDFMQKTEKGGVFRCLHHEACTNSLRGLRGPIGAIMAVIDSFNSGMLEKKNTFFCQTKLQNMRRMSIYEIKPIQFLTPRGGESPIGLSKLSCISTALENRLFEPLMFPMGEVLQYLSPWEKGVQFYSCDFGVVLF